MSPSLFWLGQDGIISFPGYVFALFFDVSFNFPLFGGSPKKSSILRWRSWDHSRALSKIISVSGNASIHQTTALGEWSRDCGHKDFWYSALKVVLH